MQTIWRGKRRRSIWAPDDKQEVVWDSLAWHLMSQPAEGQISNTITNIQNEPIGVNGEFPHSMPANWRGMQCAKFGVLTERATTWLIQWDCVAKSDYRLGSAEQMLLPEISAYLCA